MSRKKSKPFISVYENFDDNKFYVAEYIKNSKHEWSLLNIKDHIRGVGKKEDAELRAKTFADSQKLDYVPCEDDILVAEVVEAQAKKVYAMALNNTDIDDFLGLLAEDVIKKAEVTFSSGHICYIEKIDNNASWNYPYKSDYSDNPYHLLKALIHLLAINKASVMVKTYLDEKHSNGKFLAEVRGWTFIYENDDLVVQQATAEDLFINLNTDAENGQILLPEAELIYCDDSGNRYNPLIPTSSDTDSKE